MPRNAPHDARPVPTLSVSQSERFWKRVEQRGECWAWTGRLNHGGHGEFSINNSKHRAHRVAYESMVGAIPPGLVLDHLCRNPACVNPDHLDPVPQGVNVRRGAAGDVHNKKKTHCPKGHGLSGGNLYVAPSGRRGCRTCRKAAVARYVQRKSAAPGGRPIQ